MNIRQVLPIGVIICLSIVAHSQNLYKFHDAAIPDITVPQPTAQIVSPMVYAQLGSQDKELQTIESEIGGVKSNLTELKKDIKPLEETNIQVRLIMSIVGWLLGFLLASGVGAWIFHKLAEKAKSKGKSIQTGSLGT